MVSTYWQIHHPNSVNLVFKHSSGIQGCPTSVKEAFIAYFDSSLNTSFCRVLTPHCMLLGVVILHFALLKICILCMSHRDIARPDMLEHKLLLYNSLDVNWITCSFYCLFFYVWKGLAAKCRQRHNYME